MFELRTMRSTFSFSQEKNEVKNSAEFSEVFKKFPDAEIISIEHKD
mgnify:CR=1 FL=1